MTRGRAGQNTDRKSQIGSFLTTPTQVLEHPAGHEDLALTSKKPSFEFDLSSGVTAGVESASGTLRLVLACTAYTSEENHSALALPP